MRIRGLHDGSINWMTGWVRYLRVFSFFYSPCPLSVYHIIYPAYCCVVGTVSGRSFPTCEICE